MPDIANVLSTAASVGGVPVETFEVYVGRARAGDITISAADGIDLLGDGTVSYATTQTVNAGQWVKLVGWYVSGTTQRYIMDSAAQPRDAALDYQRAHNVSGSAHLHNRERHIRDREPDRSGARVT